MSTEPPTSSSPAVEVSQSDKKSTDGGDQEDSTHGAEFEVAKIRISSVFQNTIRLAGLLAVVAGLYHLFIPFVDLTLPVWAPWRVVGVTVDAGSGAVYYLGDILLMAAGAITTWFV